MKYFIIAGEASGDLHGANLINEIKKIDNNSIFKCWGGDKMQNSGATIEKHIKDLAFMGFIDVFLNIFKILKNFQKCKNDILNFKPDVVILIDYPGFNLRMAKFIHYRGFKVFYYISPTVWAWHKSRVFKIKKFVDKLFVILPFEKDFYNKYNYDVDYVGNPLLDEHYNFINSEKSKIDFKKENLLSQKPIIAILPGSRKQEIIRLLPTMIKIIDEFTEYQFVVAGVENLNKLYPTIIKNKKIQIVYNQTYSLLSNSYAAIVTSGTATLETALFNIPQVVCYKAGSLSFKIAKLLVKINYISLVNLILNKKAVTELIQNDYNAKNLITEINNITNINNRQKIIDDYTRLKQIVGKEGASSNTAQLMYHYLTKN